MSYSRVDEFLYIENTGEPVEVSTNMSVLAGDVIGFFRPRLFGIELSVAPVPDYTLLQGSRSGFIATPSGAFHESDVSSTVVGASPLVTVAYGNAYSQHLMQSYAQIQYNEILLFSRPLCVFLHQHSTIPSWARWVSFLWILASFKFYCCMYVHRRMARCVHEVKHVCTLSYLCHVSTHLNVSMLMCTACMCAHCMVHLCEAVLVILCSAYTYCACSH